MIILVRICTLHGANYMFSYLLQYLKCMTFPFVSVTIKTTWKQIFDMEIFFSYAGFVVSHWASAQRASKGLLPFWSLTSSWCWPWLCWPWLFAATSFDNHFSLQAKLPRVFLLIFLNQILSWFKPWTFGIH